MTTESRTYTEAELRIMVHAVVDVLTAGDMTAQEVEEVLDDQLEIKVEFWDGESQ